MRRQVLVTGMTRVIGSVVRRHLGEKYALSALNRRAVRGVPCHQADIADLKAIGPAFQAQGTVVHLAANSQGDASWEDVLHHNMIGTYNVFEAARRQG